MAATPGMTTAPSSPSPRLVRYRMSHLPESEGSLGSGANGRIVGLSPAKRALLELRRKRGGDPSKAGTIPRRTGTGPAPLSFTQELLWLVEQLSPGNATYSVPRAMRILGPLDSEALERTLDALVARHETLRTTFQVIDGTPMQVISEPGPVGMTVIDLGPLTELEREAEAHRILMEEAGRILDLSRDLLLRPSLIRLDDDE